jgi:hypothetical protein
MRDEGQDEDDDKAAGDYPVDWLATIQNFPSARFTSFANKDEAV